MKRSAEQPGEHPVGQPGNAARWWYLLLVLPYLGLLFPGIYARAAPALWGLPFFYWYQLAWVLVTAVLMAVVYWKTRATR